MTAAWSFSRSDRAHQPTENHERNESGKQENSEFFFRDHKVPAFLIQFPSLRPLGKNQKTMKT